MCNEAEQSQFLSDLQQAVFGSRGMMGYISKEYSGTRLLGSQRNMAVRGFWDLRTEKYLIVPECHREQWNFQNDEKTMEHSVNQTVTISILK